MNIGRRLKGAWTALAGRTAATPDALRAELLERERQVETLQAEYKRLEDSAASESAARARETLKDALRRVAPALSQLSAMRAAAEAGTEVRAADVLKVAQAVEAALERTGFRAVGSVGETAAFSARLHQRMSGGDVCEGDSVKVEFSGYALEDEVLLRAMVTRE